LLWHLHDLWPEQSLPRCALLSKKKTTRIGRRLARAEQTARVRIRPRRATPPARAEPHHRCARGRDRRARRPGRAATVSRARFGPLTAGKLIGEIAGAQRFANDAKLARAGGIAPIPISSGKTNRHRLDRGGNRQINTAIHRVAVTRARCHTETQAYMARKRAEGKTNRDAIRCLKRHLARRIWHLLQPPTPAPTPPLPINPLT